MVSPEEKKQFMKLIGQKMSNDFYLFPDFNCQASYFQYQGMEISHIV